MLYLCVNILCETKKKLKTSIFGINSVVHVFLNLAYLVEKLIQSNFYQCQFFTEELKFWVIRVQNMIKMYLGKVENHTYICCPSKTSWYKVVHAPVCRSIVCLLRSPHYLKITLFRFSYNLSQLSVFLRNFKLKTHVLI